MPAINLTAFTGEQPKIIARLLPETAATAAINVRLDDGGLTPMNNPVQADRISADDHRTIYKHGDVWHSWEQHVHAAPGPVADDRLYYTGDGAPKVKIDGVVYALAVPRPDQKLTVEQTGTGDGDTHTRIYAYTFVTSFGEESEPSPASASIEWKPGQTVTLKGFQLPQAGRSITKQRIYRTQTGSSGTYLYFIAERDASANDYIDTIPVDGFNEVLPSAAWNAPPDDLAGLTVMPNGIMAAFVGRKLYFCEPYRPHAWPEKYVLTTDSDIVGLGALGTSLIVMTKAQPYIVVGATPDTMQMQKLEANFPCINPRGIVDMGFVIAYPSNEGLITVTAQGAVSMATASILNREDWLSISPTTYIACQIGGRYVAFYDTITIDENISTGAIYLDVGQTPYIIRSNAQAAATYYDVESGSLFFLKKGTRDIYRLDAPDGYRHELYWRSKEFFAPFPLNYAAILIETKDQISARARANYEKAVADTIERNTEKLLNSTNHGEMNIDPLNTFQFAGDDLELMPPTSGMVNIGVFADGVKVAQITRTNTPVRLPSGFKARKWEIDVSSNVTVTRIVMATSIDELKQIA